jgi:hypothetical protein
MKVYSWKNHRTTSGIFQQAMFDYQRVLTYHTAATLDVGWIAVHIPIVRNTWFISILLYKYTQINK